MTRFPVLHHHFSMAALLCLLSFQHYFYPPIDILFETALHPYYKLDYFKLKWDGAEEQEEELRNGNLNAKNWQDEAQKVLESTVSIYVHSIY